MVSDIETIADEVLILQKGILLTSGSPQELIRKCNVSDLESVYMHYAGEDE